MACATICVKSILVTPMAGTPTNTDEKTQAKPLTLSPPSPPARKRSLKGVYEYYIGKRNGLDIWIVNGPFIRRKITTEFVYGGSDRVYNFIPEGEIWIDSSAEAVEAQFTIEHEITERTLLNDQGLSYDEAHKLAAEEEQEARDKNQALIEEKERETPRVPFSLSESRRLSEGSPLE